MSQWLSKMSDGTTCVVKTFATILTGFGVVLAGLQWWQIGYRLRLFYRDYDSERYSNDIGHGDFSLIYVVNLVLLLAGAFAIRTFWREPSAWRWIAISVTTVNVVAWLMFLYMHSTGM